MAGGRRPRTFPGTDNRIRSSSPCRPWRRSGSGREMPEPLPAALVRTRPGRPYPRGATWTGDGVNFALFSEHATAVDLCLFDATDPGRETHRIPVRERTDQIWHVFVPDARPGLCYGYRVHGPYEPAGGHRFNAAKVLLDPYAKAIAGTVTRSEAMFGYRLGAPEADLVPDH